MIPAQTLSVLVTAGHAYAFTVFADGTATGKFQITITSIADPDAGMTTPIVLNADGAGVQNGAISSPATWIYSSSMAPASGITTLTMSTPAFSGLKSSVTVDGVGLLSEFTPSPGGADTNNDIIQFQVVAGQQYIVRARRHGKSGKLHALFGDGEG